MKFAILVKDSQEIHDDSVGFYQWLNVFGGQIMTAEALNDLRDGAYDLIQIRLTRGNLALIGRLKERLGPHSATKIAVCLDIPVQYWRQEVGARKQLKTALLKADFIFGATYPIARALQEITGKKVYEIPHPADPDKIKGFQIPAQGPYATILDGDRRSVQQYIRRINHDLGLNLKIRVLSDGDETRSFFSKRFRKKVETVSCKNEVELCQKLAESQFVLIPKSGSFYRNEFSNYENLVVYAATLGAIVIGSIQLEAMRRCYPELASADGGNYLALYFWIKNHPEIAELLRENARVRVEFYHPGNLQKRYLDWLYDETGDERFRYPAGQTPQPSLFQKIHHLFGERTVTCGPEEFVVVCLVKNGAEYLPAFLDHHHRLGAKHLFFVDNGSTDETIALLSNYPVTRGRITVYETALPHKNYECEIRRLIIEEHCRNRWVLCADIDELFDYPGSGRVSMGLFLRYLNSYQYTAVLAYMLEMFSRELEFSPAGGGEDLVSKYCYYDISNLQKSRYNSSFTAFNNYNQLGDRQMMNYSGGIRRSAFQSNDSGYLLTKHPLIFVDSKIEPMVHPHFSNKALVADVNGLIKHYKFIASFKDKVIRSLQAGDYCYYGEQEYQEYYKVIRDQNSLNLYSAKSEKLERIDQLIEQGFLRESEKYQAYVKASPR